jgi:hypothetical protein
MQLQRGGLHHTSSNANQQGSYGSCL